MLGIRDSVRLINLGVEFVEESVLFISVVSAVFGITSVILLLSLNYASSNFGVLGSPLLLPADVPFN